MQKSAIIFGATGLVGRHVLRELLNNPRYGKVTTVARRDMNIKHAKINQLIADFQTIEEIKDQLVADDVFCCLGTTRKKTPDLQEYYRIDHDYPVALARLTKANGAKALLVVSAVGADADSANFYLRMKGQMERDIVAVGLDRTHIFRPSLITGKRSEKRRSESLAKGLFTVIDPFLIGGLSKYRSVPAAWVAKAMNRAAEQEHGGVRVYYWKHIKNQL
ncbi:oxidoreductase [Parapedobacter deserti]|uniref:Oxidoreductase n=1 Tax=Parapedobacter deserti TaxID=1912957 RepID=A0ABV7JK54_9SPHI